MRDAKAAFLFFLRIFPMDFMLQKFIGFCFVVLAICCNGQQNINTSFFDGNGYLTYEETAVYYRKNTDTVNFYRSYFIENQNKYFEGFITNAVDTADYNNRYAGTCKWYNKNGTLKLLVHYNEQGLLHGLKQEFNENGVLRKQGVYENNLLKTGSYLETDENGFTALVFDEEFKNNESRWLLETNEFVSSRIKLGGLEMTNKKNTNYVLFSDKNIDSTNFSIETSINSNYLTPESKCGIVFGFKDWNNYNYFYVSKFRFYIGSVKNGQPGKNLENYFSFELNGNGWNNVKVLNAGDSIYYYINNRLQACCPNNGFAAGREGLSINKGISLFDNFVIKQYSDAYKNKLQPDVSYSFDAYTLPVKQMNMGVLLGKNGYILTTVKDVKQVNKFVVEVYCRGSVKQYEADVFYYNPWTKFLMLKIKDGKMDDSTRIHYNYNYMKNCNTEKVMISFSADKNSETGLPALDTVSVRSMKINAHDHHYKDMVNRHSCIGSPLFNSECYILGIITDVNKENEIKVLSMQEINTYLYSNSKVIGIEYKNEVDPSTFIKNINTNIALIKSF
jgi:hypothetical protein